MPDELRMEVHDIVQETGIKTISKKKKCKKQNGCLRGPYKLLLKKKKRERERSEKHRRKGKIYPFECRVPKTSQER